MRRRYCRVLVLLTALMPLLFSCAGREIGTPLPAPVPEVPRPAEGEEAPLVRVLILESEGGFNVETAGGRLTAMREDLSGIDESEISGEFNVSRGGRGIRISGRGTGLHQAPLFVIRPVAGGIFQINGAPYRGSLMVRREGERTILAINVIEIDEYLNGVLPSEIGYLKQGQFEAYRVQAIASRSYALSKLEEKKGEPYDLRATIMDQVYKGVGGENAEASKAIDETRGIVALWNGDPIKAYYSSCCGGHTADIRVGWPWKAHYPYLYGGRDAESQRGRSFCRDSRHFRWEEEWNGNALFSILRKTLPSELGNRVTPFNRILDIETDGVSKSGRVRNLRVVTDRGSYAVEGDRIRWVLRTGSAGGPILRSTLFKMEVERSGGKVRRLRISGGGNGHGTGMCQTGAIKMAELGYAAADILLHYYPGVHIRSMY